MRRANRTFAGAPHSRLRDAGERVGRTARKERQMPGIGDQAPDFSVPDQHGNTVTLSQFRGSKNVVLSFHIFSFTGG